MILDFDDYIAHYGTPRKSGRYPWGSGDNQPPRNEDFLEITANLKKQGLSDPEIAKGFGMTTTQLRARKSIILHERKAALVTEAQRLHDKGMSNVAIGRQMGRGESFVRTLLADGEIEKANSLQSIASMLKRQVDEKKFVDIGTGVETQLAINATKLATSVAILKDEGYEVHRVKVPQLGIPGQETEFKVLCPPGTTQKEAWLNRDKIQQINEYSEDGGSSFIAPMRPLTISPSRVGVRYGPDGGAQTDGVIYVRRGVPDVSLDSAPYAQVRIAVGDGHYLKGMAMYKDDLPPGVDLLFNTNKLDTGNKLDAMKPISDDPDNPFTSSIKRQIYKTNPDGTRELTSVMNLVHEAGNWADWSKSLSTQMLSKQSTTLARTQLTMTYERRLKEYGELSNLTNPTVRKYLLEKFGDESSAAAVHLDAAGLRDQAWHAILPIDSMPPTQIYAPNYANGTTVVLIRFPHAGTFEIPSLVVNNNQPEAKRLLGGARDAVGIHHSVAEHLSGADFDGDTVLVIPNDSGKVRTSPALEGLKNFEPRVTYKAYEGMPRMTDRQKAIEMGNISNLISDMNIRKASNDEMARAVRHSMVVIDAENHHLNYKQSALDNNIIQLKQKYQFGSRAGASTLISRATAQERVLDRKARPAEQGGAIDKETGKRVFVNTDRVNYKTGQPSTIKSTKLAETDDANTLSSGTPIERVYAEHSNKLKALGDRARKEAVNTPNLKYSPSAKAVYSKEVASLNAKLALAIRNRPLERQAHVIGNAMVKAKRTANPNMDQDTRRKEEFRALTVARIRTGAQKNLIVIDQDEWNAIQAGAISNDKLSQILAKADLETVRKLATPRTESIMSSTETIRARQMLASGFTRSQVAAQLGVSVSTVANAVKEPS